MIRHDLAFTALVAGFGAVAADAIRQRRLKERFMVATERNQATVDLLERLALTPDEPARARRSDEELARRQLPISVVFTVEPQDVSPRATVGELREATGLAAVQLLDQRLHVRDVLPRGQRERWKITGIELAP